MGDYRFFKSECVKKHDHEYDKSDKWTHGPRDIYDYWPTDRQGAHDEYLTQVRENDGCPFAWLLEDL